MKLIRKNIRLISLLTICIQISIIFSLIVHNHHWHYLKLFSDEYIDNNNKQNHQDPFADESGLCRINDFIHNNFSVTIADQSYQIGINGFTSSSYTYLNYYKYLCYFSTGLRGPPLS